VVVFVGGDTLVDAHQKRANWEFGEVGHTVVGRNPEAVDVAIDGGSIGGIQLGWMLGIDEGCPMVDVADEFGWGAAFKKGEV
jgi:hypothetical protein